MNEKAFTQEEFREAAKPLVMFLQKHFHPLCTAIVTCDSAEILEGQVAEPFEMND